jgi:hypothetical protein
MNRYAIVFTVAMIAFMVSEAMMVTAQAQINSTNSDKQKIVITWLQMNETKTESDPVISVSSKDFWKTFELLLKQSINGL